MDTLKNKIIKARKPHRCYWCGSEIKKGERYRRLVEVDGGDFSHLALHENLYQGWQMDQRRAMADRAVERTECIWMSPGVALQGRLFEEAM